MVTHSCRALGSAPKARAWHISGRWRASVAAESRLSGDRGATTPGGAGMGGVGGSRASSVGGMGCRGVSAPRVKVCPFMASPSRAAQGPSPPRGCTTKVLPPIVTSGGRRKSKRRTNLRSTYLALM